MLDKLLKPRDKVSLAEGTRRRVYLRACTPFSSGEQNRMALISDADTSDRPPYPTGVVGNGVHTLSFDRSCTSGTSDRSIPGYDKG